MLHIRLNVHRLIAGISLILTHCTLQIISSVEYLDFLQKFMFTNEFENFCNVGPDVFHFGGKEALKISPQSYRREHCTDEMHLR